MILLTLFFSLSLSPINISRFYIRSMRSVAHDNPTGIERERYIEERVTSRVRGTIQGPKTSWCVCVFIDSIPWIVWRYVAWYTSWYRLVLISLYNEEDINNDIVPMHSLPRIVYGVFCMPHVVYCMW